jgi:hypothetical protein
LNTGKPVIGKSGYIIDFPCPAAAVSAVEIGVNHAVNQGEGELYEPGKWWRTRE